MATSKSTTNVRSIRPTDIETIKRRAGRARDKLSTDNGAGSLTELDRLSGYGGSIQGTPLDEALEEQRTAIHTAQAVIVCANEYISHLTQGGADEWCPQLALDAAKKMLDEVWEALDAGNLEDRALAIARGKATEAQS